VAALRNSRVKGRRTAEEQAAHSTFVRSQSLLPKGYDRVLIKKPSNKKVSAPDVYDKGKVMRVGAGI
jgi:hypothetical protein